MGYFAMIFSGNEAKTFWFDYFISSRVSKSPYLKIYLTLPRL